MRGKYQRRRRARLEGEGGVIEAAPVDTFVPCVHGRATSPGVVALDLAITESHRSALEAHNVTKLREIAAERGVTFTTRTRKADLIDLIVGAA